ncbi:MAG TPA: hypothetical protein VIK33_19740 [Anaerolineae bacterium]
MNPFVAAGAILLAAVLAGYIILTRREIAKLPPLEKPASDNSTGKKNGGGAAA